MERRSNKIFCPPHEVNRTRSKDGGVEGKRTAEYLPVLRPRCLVQLHFPHRPVHRIKRFPDKTPAAEFRNIINYKNTSPS